MRTLDKEQQIEYVYTQGIEQGIEQGQLLTLVGLAKKKIYHHRTGGGRSRHEHRRVSRENEARIK